MSELANALQALLDARQILEGYKSSSGAPGAYAFLEFQHEGLKKAEERFLKALNSHIDGRIHAASGERP